MRKLWIASAVLLAGGVPYDSDITFELAAENAVKANLDSAEFSDVRVAREPIDPESESQNQRVFVCGYVNSRNWMGGSRARRDSFLTLPCYMTSLPIIPAISPSKTGRVALRHLQPTTQIGLNLYLRNRLGTLTATTRTLRKHSQVSGGRSRRVDGRRNQPNNALKAKPLHSTKQLGLTEVLGGKAIMSPLEAYNGVINGPYRMSRVLYAGLR